VSHLGQQWTVAGHRQTIALDATNLALHIQAGPAVWDLVPSVPRDLRARSADEDVGLRLADAQNIVVTPYDTGYSVGLKVSLSQWKRPGIRSEPVDLKVYLTLALEGAAEDLVCTASADERSSVVRQLDWPAPLDAHEVDYTILPNGHGNLLPRSWPSEFNPVLPHLGQVDAQRDTSIIQSNLIEAWSMSWWGFQKGKSGLMVLVETPNDAAYQFSHPPGGPTVIGPRWRSTLGRMGYSRTVRMCFFEGGDYVAMAKRYRQYVIDRGQFVSLKLKIARTPKVAELIGTPLTRLSILHNYKPESYDFAHSPVEKHRVLHTYDERLQELQKYQTQGFEHLHVCLTGWPNQGYDRQHPDELPPSAEAGGWEGMKRFVDGVRALGYLITFHDQYRDYYVDAPSYDPQFAIHEEDAQSKPQAFAGTRYGGGTKEGAIPFLDYWEGGKQTYLSPNFMLGHLIKNYTALASHGITPDGIYLDVFGYVPPDEDYNPEHPTSRSESLADRIACYNWTRTHCGIVGTEAGCDWTVPYVDVSAPVAPGRCIDVPLFNLVYHDAIITPYKTAKKADILRGMLNAGLPQMFDLEHDSRANLPLIQAMAALHRRLATVEMTKHEFLDPARKTERTTFADGTTVAVDWTQLSYTINPELK